MNIIYDPEFVHKCLISKFDGQNAIEYVKANGGSLRQPHRMAISVIIINAILEPCPTRVLSVAELVYISEEIVKLFPGEKYRQVFYDKPKPTINKNGSGTLYAAVQGARKKKRKCSLDRMKDKTLNKKQNSEVPKEKEQTQTNPDILANLDKFRLFKEQHRTI